MLLSCLSVCVCVLASLPFYFLPLGDPPPPPCVSLLLLTRIRLCPTCPVSAVWLVLGTSERDTHTHTHTHTALIKEILFLSPSLHHV